MPDKYQKQKNYRDRTAAKVRAYHEIRIDAIAVKHAHSILSASKLTATCSRCSHCWTVRNAIQISDVEIRDDIL
jgi:hypothetical protein